jgi:hypothetical protein
MELVVLKHRFCVWALAVRAQEYIKAVHLKGFGIGKLAEPISAESGLEVWPVYPQQFVWDNMASE